MRQWVASRLQNPVVALLAKAAGWNAVSQLVTKVAMVVFTVVASRVLGVSELGFLFTLQGAMLLVAAAADAGTSTYIQQQLAGRESGSAAVASLVTLRLWLAGVVTVGWVVVAQLLWDLSVAEVVLVALGGLAFSASLFVQAVLGYLHEFRVVSEALFAGRLVLCVAAPLAFVLDGAVLVPFLLGGLAGAEVVTLLYSLWRVRTRLDGVRTAFANRPGDRRARMLLAIRASAPHTLNSLINVVVNRADALLVTVFAGLTVAGLYAPASQLQNALGGVLVLLAAGVIPAARLGATREKGIDNSRRAALLSSGMGLGLLLAAALVLSVSAGWWAPLFFGERIGADPIAFQILLFSLPIAAAGVPLQALAVARGQAYGLTAVQFLALTVCVLAHWQLDARFGAAGAAWASLSREPVLLLGSLLLLRRGDRRTARVDPAVTTPA
ncbi:oligosaccharide flippase family protein [Klenkia terrae]